MVMESGREAVSLTASVASTTKLDVPVTPGVPDTAPVVASNESPAESTPSAIVQVQGRTPSAATIESA